MAATLTNPRTVKAREEAPTPLQRHRFTVDDYRRMIEAGILTERDRVELIRGEIVEKSPIGAKHVACVNDLSHLLNRRAGDDVIVQVQNPIVLPDGSAPQPDLALVRRTYDHGGLPTVADVLLVIEVADTSRDYDRNTKFPLYAAAGVPEAWLFDLVADRIERQTEPGPDGYQPIALAGRGKSLTSTALPSVTLSIDEILPPEE